MNQNRRLMILAILLLSLVLSIRFIHLGADPPKMLSRSMGYIGDPGQYAFNARNKIISGNWKIDEWNVMYTSLIPHYTTYLVFLLFGIGIAQMNLVPAVFACLVLILFFLILKKTFSFSWAVAGTLLLGFNFQFIMFSRIAVRNMPLLFFTMLAILVLLFKGLKPPVRMFLCGLLCFLAFSTQGKFLLVLPAVFLGACLFFYFDNDQKWSPTVFPAAAYIFSFAGAGLVWFLTVFIPHKDMLMSYGGDNFSWMTPQGFADALRNFWARPLFFTTNMPILSVCASLYILILAYRAFSSPKKIPLIAWISGLWLISNVSYFSIIRYGATRHLIPLIIAFGFITIHAFHALSRKKAVRKPQKRPVLFFIFFFFWFAFVTSSISILISRPIGKRAMASRSFYHLGAALIAACLLYFIFKLWPEKRKFDLSPTLRHVILATLIVFSIGINLSSYMKWAISPQYDIRNISRDLGRFENQMVIAGLVAPLIVMENTHEAHPYRADYINKDRTFIQKYGITHAFLSTSFQGVEKKQYLRDFPGVLENARLIARYPFWTDYLEFYSLSDPSDSQPPPAEIYEGETFFCDGGLPRFDAAASGKMAFYTGRKERTTSTQLPGPVLPRGRFEFTFTLKTLSLKKNGEKIAKIEILDLERKRILASREILPRDIRSEGKYQDLILPVEIFYSSQIAFRLTTFGQSDLWFDKVFRNPAVISQ